MYKSTSAFNNLIGKSQPYKAKIEIENTEITTGFISISTFSQSTFDAFVTIGGAVAGYVEISMETPSIQLENKEFKLSIGTEVNGVIEYIPLGYYTASAPKSVNSITTFTAYDRIFSKMGGAFFSELTYPTDAINVINEISRKTGVPITTTNLTTGLVRLDKRVSVVEQIFDDDGNESTHTTYVNPFDGYTYAESLGYIAMLYCKFATMGRDGNVEFRWYTDTSYIIGKDLYYDNLESSELYFNVGQITCAIPDGTILRSGTGTESIALSNPCMTQAFLDNIYTKVKDLSFLPSAFSMIGDIRLDLGDMVHITDAQGNTRFFPIMLIQHTYDGGIITNLSCFGKTNQESKEEFKGAIAQQLDRQFSELLLVKELIGNKASFDDLSSTNATFKNVYADYGQFKDLYAQNFASQNAKIETLESNQITTEYLDVHYATVDMANINDASITTAKIQNGAITNAKIGDAAITTAKIENGAIDTALIKDGAITNEKVQNLSANKITSGSIDASKINVTNLNADNLTVGTINGQRIGNASIDLSKLSEKVPTKDYLDTVQSNLQDQIDGAIETFTTTVIPTLSNEPAKNWKTADERKKHIGDICYVINPGNDADGFCYRFSQSGSAFSWTLIKDNQVTAALQRLIDAEGNISNLQSFESTTSKWIEDTDEKLETTYVTNSTLTTTLGDYVEESSFNTKVESALENSTTITNISTKIENDSTNFESKISEKASTEEVIEVNNQMNEVRQTINENTSTISALTTVVEGNRETIESRMSQMVQDLNSFRSEITSTYQKKDDVEEIRQQLSSILQEINQIRLEVIDTVNDKAFTTGQDINSYRGQGVPTLLNYPASTEFFEFKTASDSIACSESYVCGTNKYADYYDNKTIYLDENEKKYYLFDKDASGNYYWKKLTDEEYEAMSNKYSSIKVTDNGIEITSMMNDKKSEMQVTPNGIMVTNGQLLCC